MDLRIAELFWEQVPALVQNASMYFKDGKILEVIPMEKLSLN